MGKQVLYNIANTYGNMSPLLFFDIIFDIDFGMISYIAKYLLDPNVFEEEKFHWNVKEIIGALSDRKEKNPLSFFLKEEYRADADEYYNEILKEGYDEILDMSMMTEIFTLVTLFSTEPDIKVTVLCENESQMKIWKEIAFRYSLTGIVSVLEKDINQNNIQTYQQIYCKHPSDIIRLQEKIKLPIIDKSIYVASYPFNMVNSQNINPDLDIISVRNSLNSIDIYRKNLLKEEE